jgi:hypothetical protein
MFNLIILKVYLKLFDEPLKAKEAIEDMDLGET